MCDVIGGVKSQPIHEKFQNEAVTSLAGLNQIRGANQKPGFKTPLNLVLEFWRENNQSCQNKNNTLGEGMSGRLTPRG